MFVCFFVHFNACIQIFYFPKKLKFPKKKIYIYNICLDIFQYLFIYSEREREREREKERERERESLRANYSIMGSRVISETESSPDINVTVTSKVIITV